MLDAGAPRALDAATPALDAGDEASDEAGADASRAPSTVALRDLVGLSDHPALGTDVASVNERAFEWSKLAELGVHRLRTDFDWSQIEAQKGTFVFTPYDTLVADATAHDVDVLGILDYGVPWATSASGADEYYPPDDPDDFATFAGAVAMHFLGTVHNYEVWNEPNNGLSFWKPTLTGDPAKYGALLADATSAVLAAAPTANVAYGGTVYDYLTTGPDFVAQSFQANAGLAAGLGTFAMHAYEKYPPASAPESAAGEEPLPTKVTTMSSLLAAAGAKPAPLWITEIGWPTTDADPPAQQARYTVRAVLLAALAGADRVYLYTLLDGPNPTASPPEDAFGLVSYQADWADGGAPADKPSFVALKAILGAVGAYAVTGRLAATPADVYLVELVDPAGTKGWVAWRSLDGVPAASVTVPATGDITVTQVDGTTLDDTANGAYVVQVGPDPVAITAR